jgi:hypothetical protein
VLWCYLAERTDGEDADAPLFLVRYDRPMNKTALRLQIVHVGECVHDIQKMLEVFTCKKIILWDEYDAASV